MNKKFLSAILFGALMVTSTGTFVSCKDYDDDIENLQSQIDKLATKDELTSQIATLQAALNAAAANADAAIKKAEGAEKTAAEAEAAAIAAAQEEVAKVKAELEKMIANGQGTNTEALTEMNKTVKDVEAKVTALIGEVTTMVTDVALGATGDDAYCYAFTNRVIEKTAVFGDKTAIKANETLSFTEGTIYAPESGDIVVRVSPTNAVLKAENISLIDSEGNDLNDYLEVASVSPFSAVYGKYETYNHSVESRAASVNKSGLWVVTFKLKETADLEAFEKEIGSTEKKAWQNNETGKWYDNVYKTRYALAVKNTATEEGAAERNVVSGYGLRLFTNTVEHSTRLNFYADDTNVQNIRNRWTRTEAGNNADVCKVQELQWLSSAKNIPAVAPTLEGDELNVEFKVVNDAVNSHFDNRQYRDLLPVVKGEPIEIRINAYKNGDEWIEGQQIAGFYVTLDKENALESAPSEINAWNSYSYENVGTDHKTATMFKGNYGTITIKDMGNVVGDVIGFRVYAVNLDGTLMDPDGRAFYVSVGNPAAEAQTIAATITPKSAAENTVTVDLTTAQSSVITSLLKNQTNNSGVVMDEDNAELVMANGTIYDATYDVTFIWNDNNTVVAKAKFTLNNVANFINDKTYKASIVYKNATLHELGTVNFELTKTMPTVFPTDFAFRPKQETEDGSGKFIAYMIPENGYTVNPASANGVKDMNNVFYGLNNDYKFIFATSAKNADNELINVEVEATPSAQYLYELEVAKAFIDNTEWHNVTVNYFYRGVSTYYDAKIEDYVVGEDHTVTYANPLQVMYSCWHDASKFDWAKDKKPALQWTAEGKGATAEFSNINSTNSYNNDFFGLDLKTLIETKGWLRLATAADDVEEPIKLVVNGQVNPYFEPSINGSTIEFAQKDIQVDAAPVADHEETLQIAVVDAYGHIQTISLAVTVKAPTKK